MLLGRSYRLVLFIVDLVLVRTRSDAQPRAEVRQVNRRGAGEE